MRSDDECVLFYLLTFGPVLVFALENVFLVSDLVFRDVHVQFFHGEFC